MTEQPEEADVFIEVGADGSGDGPQTSAAGAGIGDRARGGSGTSRRSIVAIGSRDGGRSGLGQPIGISAGTSFGKIFSTYSFGVAAGISTGFGVCCVKDLTSDAASGTGLPGGVKGRDDSSGSPAAAGVGKGDPSATGNDDGG